jgi:hypothetical protein
MLNKKKTARQRQSKSVKEKKKERECSEGRYKK